MVPLKKVLPSGGTSTGSSTPRSQIKAQRPSFKDLSVRSKSKEITDMEVQQRMDIEVLKEEVLQKSPIVQRSRMASWALSHNITY